MLADNKRAFLDDIYIGTTDKGRSIPGSTGTASVYDDRILDQPTGWPLTPFGVETNIYSIVFQLSADIKQLSEEIRLLKEQLVDRPLVSSVTLSNLNNDSFEIIKPISIILEETDEESLARWPEVNGFGIGSTVYEAISDLKKNICELYSDINSHDQATLGELALETLRTLDIHIRVRK
jgi:hypothetical protein